MWPTWTHERTGARQERAVGTTNTWPGRPFTNGVPDRITGRFPPVRAVEKVPAVPGVDHRGPLDEVALPRFRGPEQLVGPTARQREPVGGQTLTP